MENNSFDVTDLMSAKEVFSRWQAENSEEIDDYILRQRKAELLSLVRRVIENELSEQDRLLVDLLWYKGVSMEDAAAALGVSRSTVYRRYEKINGILYDRLKYAVEYRCGVGCERVPMVLVKLKPKEKGGTAASPAEAGGRLFRLRESQLLSREEVCKAAGISAKRLAEIEADGAELTVGELKRLSSFYRVSSDYIIFGSHRVLRDPLTGMPIQIDCKRERL